MQIRSNDRAFLAGKTGSGKTTLAKKMLSSIKKGKVSILYHLRSLEPYGFNKVCQILYTTGNFTLFVDEVSKVCTPSWIEPWHDEIMTRGRGRAFLHIFRLQLETDIAKIKEILPRKYAEMVSALPYHHCIYTDNSGIIKMLSPIRI